MKNKKMIIIGSLCLIAIILIAIFLLKKKRKVVITENGTGTGTETTDTGTTENIKGITNENAQFPLMKGCRGKEVKAVQRVLNQYLPITTTTTEGVPMYIEKLTIDGIFGEKTENALWTLSYKRQITEKEYIEGFKAFEK